MADDTDDVLELEDEVETTDDDEEGQDGEAEGQEDGEEPFIGFEGDEAAPASEGDSSVIRELRKANRELAKKLTLAERGAAPKKIEVGEKPTLESCEYDEERFETALTSWHQRKAQADAQEGEAQEAAEKRKAQWAERQRTYEADKATLGVSGFEDAEGDVASVLPQETMALIMLTEKPAALVYALSRAPTQLTELSKLDPAHAAIKIGQLTGKLHMGTRKPPQPDQPVRGTSTPKGADKELARLEKEAERTGNRTAVIRYKKQLRGRA